MQALPKIRQHNAQVLAHGYSPAVRRLEIASILTYFALMVVLAVRLVPLLGRNPWLMLAAATCGYLGADFVSGFVHWMADTWGSPDMPVVGKALIRPFREHHVDQVAITRHDFVETNGNNCLISITPLVIAIFLPLDNTFNIFAASFVWSLVLWVFGTNQFHKWAHMQNPPLFVSALQKCHLILPPSHHSIHHTAPFNRYYSITVGWVNWPLYLIRFYPALEAMVTWVSGALPRADDIGEHAAREIATVVPRAESELPGSVSQKLS